MFSTKTLGTMTLSLDIMRKRSAARREPEDSISNDSEHGDEDGSDSDTDSSHLGESTFSNVTETSNKDSTPVLAKSENKMVKRSKILVFLVLLCAAGICGGATYAFTRQGEDDDFQTKFDDYASELVEVSLITAKNIFATIKGLSVTITSYAIDKNVTWPYVTVPHYENRVLPLNDLGVALYLWFGPLIKPGERQAWEQWSVENQGWIPEKYDTRANKNETLISKTMQSRLPNGTFIPAENEPDAWYVPIWQSTPINPPVINWNAFNITAFRGALRVVQSSRSPVLSEFTNYGRVNLNVSNSRNWPRSRLVAPIFDGFAEDSNIVAVMGAVVQWHRFFLNVLPEGAKEGLIVVIENTCDQVVTYKITGPDVEYLGEGDLHRREFDELEVTANFTELLEEVDDTCAFTLRVYPSEDFRDSLYTDNPLMYTVAVVLIFVITSSVFVIYDCLVEKRQKKVMTSAERSNAIVTSLFPAQVRERLLAEEREAKAKKETNPFLRTEKITPGSSRQNEKDRLLSTKPIADLFPHATVMFADIVDFTAWSSVREPSQVFMLLEQIYNSFDVIAKRRRVFKVETIGDCYVAAAGLPEPRRDHVEVMAKFAYECRSRMNRVVKRLEVNLGPDTGELCMRFGLHSGPVTAGVLRGEKSRFQLFGDTVNTAARIESTGARNMIHVSQETANLLISSGKSDWVRPRENLVAAKGKGLIQTFWLTIKGSHGERFSCHGWSETESQLGDRLSLNDRTARLIGWNVDVLHRQLRKIVAMRDAKKKKEAARKAASLSIESQEGRMVLDEVKEIISLPSKASEYLEDPETVELGPNVMSQLRDYVAAIATMYRDNPFHCFDHASHVTQSVTKLLARVVTPDSIDYNDMKYKRQDSDAKLHEYTYGITSDPLTQFACIFSALIHDVDHPGVPNSQLVAEKAEIAETYKHKSVAEQNSVDVAWTLLMESSYSDLRKTIYANEEELARFRELVVNSVMATDVVDKELGALRKKRWEKAFSDDDSSSNLTTTPVKEDSNRKATIVIEHLIQASDVAHTMQHWHVYQKWNRKLFNEMYKAYLAGRAVKDPKEIWYQGEIGFFDFYIIPLAKKLKECGVFGVASDEYLNYAMENRREWEQKGRDVVAGYVSSYQEEQGISCDEA